MPELGKYAVEVLSAYAASILLLVALILATREASKKAKAALKAAEAEAGRDG